MINTWSPLVYHVETEIEKILYFGTVSLKNNGCALKINIVSGQNTDYIEKLKIRRHNVEKDM